MREHEKIFSLVVQSVCCWLGGERNNAAQKQKNGMHNPRWQHHADLVYLCLSAPPPK